MAQEVPLIMISLTLWYMTKLWAIVSNTNYFKPNILKFKTFIYNSNCKIIYNFCIYGCNTLPVVRESNLLGKEMIVLHKSLII